MPKSIGIVGGGVVGQAVKAFFTDALVYDKFQPVDPWETVAKQAIIFICVPTPFHQGFDDSAVVETLERLKDEPGQIVVIKSTVIPGTTERLQKKYPNLRLLFSPEFLDNKTAVQDFRQPDKQIIGATEKSRAVAAEILSLLPIAPYQKVITATAAEMVKYMVNGYYALRVVFANQIYDVCEKLGIQYDTVREAFEHDRRVARGHFDVWYGNYRGYDGKCLPKDTAALIDLGKKVKARLTVLEEAQQVNQQLRKLKKA